MLAALSIRNFDYAKLMPLFSDFLMFGVLSNDQLVKCAHDMWDGEKPKISIIS